MSFAKHWCFTSYEEKSPFMGHGEVSYCIVGREVCPKTKRKHLQGYLCLKDRKRISFLKKIDPKCHFEVKRGTVSEAINYCKKDGDFEEFGDTPDESGSNNSFRHCVELAKAGKMEELSDEYPGLFTRYKRTYETMRAFDVPMLDEPCGVWIQGPPGCGKDGNVIAKYNPYVKQHNKWWDGYAGQEVVLISDVDNTDAKWIGNFLKIWTDVYPFRGEIKGGTVSIRPKKFFVTSNYPIEVLFDDLQLIEALKRRFEVIDCFDGFVVTKRPRIELDLSLTDLI